ncbi:MAG: hypothetical protein IJH43_02555 [Mogibacterium sp.]|nr:hypothetical protein [Mogibacterium sp.]
MIRFVAMVIVLLAIYALLVFCLGKLNFSNIYRFLQAPFVAASVIYSIAASAAFIFILGGVDALMSLKFVTDIVLEGVPAKSYSPAFMLVITLIGNIIYMIGALIVIGIVRSVKSHNKGYGGSSFDNEMAKFTNRYYELEDGEGWPYIRNEHILTAKWLNSARKVILVLFIVWLMFACLMLYSGIEKAPEKLLVALKYFIIILSAAYVPIAEMFYFLDGISRFDDVSDFNMDFDIDEVGLTRIGNYEMLIRHFQLKYGDMIANNGKCLVEKASVQQAGPNDVGEQMVKRSKNANAYNSIIKSIKYNTDTLSENNYTEATLSLVNGDSIIVADSIYGEILLYVAGFLNYRLSSGGKALIVTSYKSRVERIREELYDRLSRINDLDPVWKIGTIEDNWAITADIVVCSIDKLDLIGNQEFTSQIGCVIVDDPSGSFVSAEVAQRMSYMKITGEIKDRELQYIFICNEDNRNLEEGLEHIVGHDLKSFKSSTAKADFYCMIWKNESFNQPQTRIGIQPYIGNASLISLEAARLGVRSIGMWVDGTIPFVTYRDLMMQNMDEIRQKFLRTSAINMNDIVTYNASENYRKGLRDRGLNTVDEKNELKFIIEYDVDNNLLTVAKAWSNYALNKNTLITIVSDTYMLRGYLADNLATLVHTPSIIKQIIPSKGEDVHRSNELLLLRLYRGMRSDYLIEAYNSFNGTHFTSDQIEECLEALLSDVCPDKLIKDGAYGCFTFTQDIEFSNDNNDPKYVNFYTIRLTNAKVYDFVLNKTNYAKIRFGTGDDLTVLPIDIEDIYNYYLPKQMHCFDGELAVIKKIKPNGEILIERTTPQDVRSYVSIAEYRSGRCSEESVTITHSGHYSLSEITADIEWEISGYYNFKKGNQLFVDDPNLGRRETFVETHLAEPITVKRDNKRGIVLRLGQVCDSKEKVELTLALMLNELFKTLFPNNFNDMAACAVRFEKMNELLENLPAEEKPIADIIPCIAIEGFHSSDFPEIVLFEKSANERGLLSEVIDEVNLQNIFDILYSYLKWELEADEKYLSFGFEQYPSLLDIEGTLKYLESVRTLNNEPVSDVFDFMDITTDVCQYCGRPLGVEAVKTDDGRIMCVECRNQLVTSQAELKEIFMDATSKLKSHYGLGTNGKQPWDIRHVGFKNAQEIIRRTGSSSVLGFYNFKRHELWILKAVPRAYEFSTLVHELVHAWQHQNFPRKALNDRDLAEGQAMWVEIEMARLEHQEAYAEYLERALELGLITSTLPDGTEFSYSVGYFEMKKRMDMKKETENAFDVAMQWAKQIAGM